MKTSQEIRKAFIDYWTSEPRNAREIPNASLVPNNDPTLLFVNSGMFPVNPYLAGQPHPLGDRLCNIQRCLRTLYDEMLEVGDNRHTLMFEMMGDWSLGSFTKAQQIPWIFRFWVDELGIDPKRIYVTVFEGNDAVPRDQEAIDIWKETFRKYGIEAEFSEDITQIPADLEQGENWKYRIFPYEKKKNWWQRASDAPGELGGPTSEMFYDMGVIEAKQDKYHINDDSGRFIEIGNNVFMEYKFNDQGKWEPMQRKNIDFGGGFERVVMIAQGKTDIFETDIYQPILERISALSGKRYKLNGESTEDTRYFRILADHSRAAAFILADGVTPSNKDQGYILRRFIRRLVRYGIKLEMKGNFTRALAESVVDKMGDVYPHLRENQERILQEIDLEETKFRKTLDNGLKEIRRMKDKGEQLNGEKAFYIYETFGFPLEMSLDEFGISDKEAAPIESVFNSRVTAHRDLSRAGAEQKFKGGLADHSEDVIKLHTAHHLLLEALRRTLGDHVRQRGSNITGERLRIDFSHDTRLTDEQILEVERIVNEAIEKQMPVVRVELPREQAEKIGAQMEFGQKYPDTVTVYFIGPESGKLEDADSPESMRDDFHLHSYFSAEFCGGPHIENTGELSEDGKKFKILKEESSGSGIRRIKAGLV